MDRLRALTARGVICPFPGQVAIDESIQPDRIAPGVVLHPGTRIAGAETSIGPACEIGEEGPAVVEDCQLGHGVRLKGGYFSGAVFLDGAVMGSAAHVRPGTLIEEQAEAAHAVGFKQTILMPYVVTGSLINFCDILMAGGTSRKDHSEVGSSYVHFNFTPHGDKATASLVGDVPRGVLLDQPRIFLGGQGGVVGPSHIDFGTVIPAGRVHRGDIEAPGMLWAEADTTLRTPRLFSTGVYRSVDRLVRANLRYIGNLRALRAWYRAVRIPLLSSDAHRGACCTSAARLLRDAVKERVKRMDAVAAAMPRSMQRTEHPAARQSQERLEKNWPAMRESLLDDRIEESGSEHRDRLLASGFAESGRDYLNAIATADTAAKTLVHAWLDAIVSEAISLWDKRLRDA